MRSSPHLPLALYFRTNQISRPDWFLLSAERELGVGRLLSPKFLPRHPYSPRALCWGIINFIFAHPALSFDARARDRRVELDFVQKHE